MSFIRLQMFSNYKIPSHGGDFIAGHKNRENKIISKVDYNAPIDFFRFKFHWLLSTSSDNLISLD